MDGAKALEFWYKYKDLITNDYCNASSAICMPIERRITDARRSGTMTLFAPNLSPVMNTRRPQATFIQQLVVFQGRKSS